MLKAWIWLLVTWNRLLIAWHWLLITWRLLNKLIWISLLILIWHLLHRIRLILRRDSCHKHSKLIVCVIVCLLMCWMLWYVLLRIIHILGRLLTELSLLLNRSIINMHIWYLPISTNLLILRLDWRHLLLNRLLGSLQRRITLNLLFHLISWLNSLNVLIQLTWLWVRDTLILDICLSLSFKYFIV